jgi:hypothetical protein
MSSSSSSRLFNLAPGVVELPASLLGRGSLGALELLRSSLALKYTGVLSPAECAAWTQAVYAARKDWTANFGGIQFTLGRAYYVHLEQEQVEEYFDNAAASRAIVERAVPGLHARMARLVRTLVRAPVAQRPDWCGAGVHIFPAGGECAKNGGDLHFDVEGLSFEQLESEAPALTCVLMLQPPTSGGELQVWNRMYEGEAEVAPEELSERGMRSALCHYGAGDLVIIDSRRLHVIMPFGGSVDRISITVHAVYVDEPPPSGEPGEAGHWQVWF